MDFEQFALFLNEFDKYGLFTGYCLIALCIFIISLSFALYVLWSLNLFRNLERYIEFSLLRDFPEYVKSEKSAKWLDKVRLWFIRNS